jgi:hypothetical protein
MYSIRKMSFGEFFSKGFELVIENLAPLLIISIIVNVPMVIISAWVIQAISNNASEFGVDSIWVQLIPLFFAGIIFGIIESGLSVRYLANRFTDKKETLVQFLKLFFATLPALLILILLTTLATVLGMVLLIIPGIIISVGLTFAIHVVVIEGLGPIEAMKRSWYLTSGYRWQIFFVGVILNFAGNILERIITPMAAVFLNNGASMVNLVLYSIFSSLPQIIISPLTIAIYLLIYFSNRIEKEGFGIENLIERYLDETP